MVKKTLTISLVAVSLLMAQSNGKVTTGPSSMKVKNMASNRILVKFKEYKKTPDMDASKPFLRNGKASNCSLVLTEQAQSVLKRVGGKVEWISDFSKVAVIKLKKGEIGKAIETLYRSGLIEYAEPDYKVKSFRIKKKAVYPNDTYFDELWGLNNDKDTDIDAPEAWSITKSGAGVWVGVVDTGVDYTHEDLKQNMWKNPKEIPNNGKDDDGNGWVDDVYGADFYNNDSDPMDDNEHGTHVSGTIGARGNNGKGVVGVAWYAKIMALKFLSSGGWGYTSDAIRAIDYYLDILKRNNVKKGILSNSWGGGGFSQALYDEIDACRKANVLFVAAAGNDGEDTDEYPTYPADYNLSNIISVGASTEDDDKAWFSNYGKSTVDLFAPGYNIYSTIPGDDYTYLSGTSMATPHVSGAAAVLWSKYPGLKWQVIKGMILNGTDQPEGLDGTSLTDGRLNLNNSLKPWMKFKPSVFKLSSDKGDHGDTIEISGFNFGSKKGKIKIGNKFIFANNITNWNNAYIKFKIPKYIPYGAYNLTVITASGKKSLPLDFDVSVVMKEVGRSILGHAWNAYGQVGTNLYMLGGGTDWGQTGIVEKCSLAWKPRCIIDSKWMMPTPLTNMGSAVRNKEIWVVGGLDWNDEGVSDKIQIFNTVTETWRNGPTLPEPLVSPAVFFYGNKLYVVGGENEDNEVTDTVRIYNLTTKKWSVGTSKPTATEKSLVSKIGATKFLISGGFTSRWCGDETDIAEIYDAKNDSWTSAPNMNTQRGGAAGFIKNGKVYAMMGNCSDTRNDGEYYEIKTRTWKTFVSGESALYVPSAGVNANKGYVLGGFDEGRSMYNREIYQFGLGQ